MYRIFVIFAVASHTDSGVFFNAVAAMGINPLPGVKHRYHMLNK